MNTKKKTICRRGHDLTDPRNIYMYRTGKRECRLCRDDREKKRWAAMPVGKFPPPSGATERVRRLVERQRDALIGIKSTGLDPAVLRDYYLQLTETTAELVPIEESLQRERDSCWEWREILDRRLAQIDIDLGEIRRTHTGN